ncbi:DNA polymerase I [Cocos nucifera]|uniref:DNA polymerase I n=1 Tax=Cocos nucifera TaxID=13894 RepID=A0A8K0MY85_COCNU|nr:DNA polymerase I [Cocos nucifera]
MERSTPVRKSHTSTADLLTWTEAPQAAPPTADWGSRRPYQPSGGISKVLFGGQMTEEEAESVLKRKPCSGPKLKEMTGSGIFAADSEDDEAEPGSAFSTPNNRTGSRIYQQTVSAISQISFSADESVTPKKPISIAEVAKQRELSGTLQSESEAKMKKQLSDAKCKELSGHDIFAPLPEISPEPLTAQNLEMKGNDIGESTPRNSHPSTKVSSKATELTGNDIFKGDAPTGSVEKPLSVAKMKEMSGSNIFADEKTTSRDYFGGVRKPPGGESSITLV